MAEVVRHIRTGDLYEVLSRSTVIHSDVPLSDDAPVTICRRLPDGQVVARFGPTPRGSFDVLHHSRLQTDELLHDGADIVVYRALNGGPVWARRAAEMDDGRFEAAPGAHPAGALSILEERVKAGVRYFRDGAAVRTGVLPDHASHIADVLQSLLSEPVSPRAAEPPGDTLVQARRLAADLAEERFRGDVAALVLSGAGDEHPWVQMALRGLQAARSTVRDRQRESDGWCAWPPSTSHALRITLYVGGKTVAELEAFSMNGPWYANAVTPEGEHRRLGAGGTLHGAVAWCEKTTGYLAPGAKLAAADDTSYQDRVHRHFQYVAGDDPTDLPERRDRANEEFAELMQALGGTLDGWIAIGRYVWNRPVGEPAQEMGGTLNTLAALAAWAGLDMMACAEAELARTMRPEIIAKIRHKRSNRHGRGVLPGDDADLVTSVEEA